LTKKALKTIIKVIKIKKFAEKKLAKLEIKKLKKEAKLLKKEVKKLKKRLPPFAVPIPTSAAATTRGAIHQFLRMILNSDS
jgi:hypothetical protein